MKKLAIGMCVAVGAIAYNSVRDPLRDILDASLFLSGSKIELTTTQEAVQSENESLWDHGSGAFVQQPALQSGNRGASSSGGGSNQRIHYTVLQAFREAIGKNWQSTIRVLSNGRQVAMGTIVDGSGWAVTKASELPEGEIECRLSDGTKTACKVMTVRSDLDLALLKIDRQGLRSIEWSDSQQLDVGAWVASADFKETPISIGVISVGPRAIRQEKAVLGISFEQVVKVKSVSAGSPAYRAGFRNGDTLVGLNHIRLDSRQALVERWDSIRTSDLTAEIQRDEKRTNIKLEPTDFQNSGLNVEQQILVTMVLKGSGAYRAGIKESDVILSINGSKVSTRQQLLDKIAAMRAGQELQLEIDRQGSILTRKAELMDLNNALLDPSEAEVNGSISARSTGFGSVLQHDTVLFPTQCGGPLIDLHGKAIGVNIARAGRVSTYALPASVLRPAIEEMLASVEAKNLAGANAEGTIIRAQDASVRSKNLK